MAFKMKGNPMQRNFGAPLRKDPTDKELEAMVNVKEVEVKAKKDEITLEKPTKQELAKAKRRGTESDDGQTATMKVNKTTGKSEMVTVVSDTDKYNARKAAEKKVFDYNKANKGKPGYVRQTFAKNISKDNKYIS